MLTFTLTLHYHGSTPLTARWQKKSTDVSITEFAHLENGPGGRGCANLRPGVSCRRRCLVTVSVTPVAAAQATFRIDQDPGDLDSPHISLTPGTQLHRLLISPRKSPRGLSLTLDHATVATELVAKLGFGEVRKHSHGLHTGGGFHIIYTYACPHTLWTATLGGAMHPPHISQL